MDELMEMIKQMAEEAGAGENSFEEIPEGTYWVEIDAESSHVYETKAGDRFRLGWVVTDGDHKGRHLADFIRWEHDTPKTAAFFHLNVANIIKALSFASGDEETQSTLLATLSDLRQCKTDAEAFEVLPRLVQAAEGVRFPVANVKNSKGYTNLYYTSRKGGAVEGVDPREVEAIPV